EEKPTEVVKKAKYQGKIITLGAIARINNNAQQLNPKAKKILKESGLKLPFDNPFYNILAQAIEIVHSIEECQILLKKAWKMKKQTIPQLIVREGKGLGVAEAPRGTLYHYYEIDKNGLIKNCRIITPTAQFLSSIEEDLKLFLPNLKKLSKKECERKIKMLIRAYDPCISCATH
ncbi:MAG: nickel-dependent hydrogenase large subunit, partial [Patescibacteria group bacterium]